MSSSYFDISKAFETVSHGILLKKLWSIGITNTLWSWLKDYLSNRYQKVTINNSYSDPLPVVSGVPQGSILGPLLFIGYMNDMSSYINHSQYIKFVDDTKCFLHINTLSDHIALQEDTYYCYLHLVPSPGFRYGLYILRILFTFPIKASWILYTPYLIHVYHVPIPIKILESHYLWTYHGTNTTKLLPLVHSKCWD